MLKNFCELGIIGSTEKSNPFSSIDKLEFRETIGNIEHWEHLESYELGISDYFRGTNSNERSSLGIWPNFGML